jgi:hypothetical protein
VFNRSVVRLAAAVVAVLAIASTIAFSAGNPGYPQVALTDAVVQQFIASYPAVKATADKIGKKYNIARVITAIIPTAGARGWRRGPRGARWTPW